MERAAFVALGGIVRLINGLSQEAFRRDIMRRGLNDSLAFVAFEKNCFTANRAFHASCVLRRSGSR